MKSGTVRHNWAVALIPLTFLTLALLLTSSVSTARAAGIIETYVGGGSGDGADAIDATIDPRGMVLVGNDIYIADGKNNRVRRVDGNTGLIETIAGNGTAGYNGDNIQGQNASLSLPLDVAVDGAGNVFIADLFNNRIRRVGTDGRISTIAGTGAQSYTGEGIATQEALSGPYGVAVGPDGSVYIADSGNNRIRKLSPPGCAPPNCQISTVAGNGNWAFAGDGGSAVNAALRSPTDIAFDGAGNMYIADWGNNRVRRVTTNGIINTIAGGGVLGAGGSIGDGGPGTWAVMYSPVQIALDSSGNVYVADTGNKRIRMLQAGTFIISTVAGNGIAGSGGDGGAPTSAELYIPYGVDATTPGNFWVAQTTDLAVSQHNRVRKVTNFAVINSVVGGGLGDGGAAIDALVDPRGGEAVDAGGFLPDVYFADGANNVVRRVDGRNGVIHTIAGSGVAGYSGDNGSALSARLRSPQDAAYDPTSGAVYVADYSNNVVRKILNGVITTVAGTGTWGYNGEGIATQANLAAPYGVDVDRFGNLYIADYENNRIRKVSNGQISTVAGNGNWGYNGDNIQATAATLRNPSDVVAADDGSLYIADSYSSRIRRVSPSGIITTFAGNGLSGFSGDTGPATFAKISIPTSLALDASGDLFFADSQNRRVRRVDGATLTINTVAGNGQTGASGDGGSAVAASFNIPTGVAVGGSGAALFIAAKDDRRIRLVSFGAAPPPTATFTPTPIAPSPTSAANTPTRTPTITQTPSRTPTSTVTNTPGVTNVSLSGSVTYYSNGLNVPSVDVDLTGPASQIARTNSGGDYGVSNVPSGFWNVEPAKHGGIGSAVSSLDAARVLQVVAGLITFNPMQRLACDVTGDGTLSALDATRILQYSAGVISVLPVSQLCQSDWAFSPSPDLMLSQDVNLPVIGGSVCHPGNIDFNPLAVTARNQDFNAVLFGDCTGNWTPAIGGALKQRAAATTTVDAGKLRRAPNDRWLLPVYVRGRAPYQALDITVTYDASSLGVRTVHPRGAAAAALIGVGNSEPGVLTVSLASGTPIPPNGLVLMVEFYSDGTTGSFPVELVQAQIDEQAARVVTHGVD